MGYGRQAAETTCQFQPSQGRGEEEIGRLIEALRSSRGVRDACDNAVIDVDEGVGGVVWGE